MFTILLLTMAEAAPGRQGELLIDATPEGNPTKSSSATFIDRPKGASPSAPWVSDYAAVTCENQDDVVAVSIALDAKAWPYALPEKVTCTQGKAAIEVRLGFGRPEVNAWVAADGTIVVPAAAPTPGQRLWRDETIWLPDIVATSAHVSPPATGLGCSATASGGVVIELRVAGAAVDPAVCHITTASGAVVDRTMRVLAYAE